MRDEQIFEFERDLAKLCNQYNISCIAGFFISAKMNRALNASFVVTPMARKGIATRGYVNRVSADMDVLIDKHTPLPDSIDK